MSKMVISEERLQELVRESIYEVLNESEFDEGFGHWLGQTYQGIKNKWNNFKKDFNAGRDKARFDNKDYNNIVTEDFINKMEKKIIDIEKQMNMRDKSSKELLEMLMDRSSM